MCIDDTIVAISTPLGEGGIGIIRLSGKDAVQAASRIFRSTKDTSLLNSKSHRIIHGHVVDPSTGKKIDEVLITVMKSPYSYTKEDVVEINCHSGMITLRETLALVLQQGTRLAEPGEFTKRAFLNGRIDLSQAEAVIDLIRSKTDESRRIALEQLQGGLSEKITALRDRLTEVCANIEAHIDFPEDEIEPAANRALLETMKNIEKEQQMILQTYDEARFFREGLSTVIVGRPNVGKSSLLNAVLKRDRAIVTEMPGTTRDVIEEYLNINGLPLRIMDTAGIRAVQNIAEQEGVKRSLQSIENADLVMAIFDSSEPLMGEDLEVIERVRDKNTIFVFNKSDLPAVIDQNALLSLKLSPSLSCVKISATRGDGIEELKSRIFKSCLKDWREVREGVVISNLRHKNSLEHAKASLSRAILAFTEHQPLEIITLEVRDSLGKLGEIVGVITTDDILNKIFSDFCIGK
jgi:tRNA modification GTPase